MLYFILLNCLIHFSFINGEIGNKTLNSTIRSMNSTTQNENPIVTSISATLNQTDLQHQYKGLTNTSLVSRSNINQTKSIENPATTTEFDRVYISISNVTFPKTKESEPSCCQNYEEYVVSLRRAKPLKSDLFVHVCIAILLTRNVILSAAHCFYDQKGSFIDHPDYYRVVVGRNINTPFVPGILVREILQHPEYVPYIRKNNIGLVKLEHEIPGPLKPMINAVNFNDLTKKDNCSQLYLTSAVQGNDALQDGYKISVRKVNILHWIVCMKLYEKWGVLISRNQLCAKKNDECTADEGSILMCNDKLTGILSFRNNERGFKFYSDILPDVFTAVSQYQYFLNTNLNEIISSGNKKTNNNDINTMILSITLGYMTKILISTHLHDT